MTHDLQVRQCVRRRATRRGGGDVDLRLRVHQISQEVFVVVSPVGVTDGEVPGAAVAIPNRVTFKHAEQNDKVRLETRTRHTGDSEDRGSRIEVVGGRETTPFSPLFAIIQSSSQLLAQLSVWRAKAGRRTGRQIRT